MKSDKIQTISMHLEKIIKYSCYIDTFSRLIREFLENGYDNLKHKDLINIVVLMEKYTQRLHICIEKAQTDWEFM